MTSNSSGPDDEDSKPAVAEAAPTPIEADYTRRARAGQPRHLSYVRVQGEEGKTDFVFQWR